MTIAVCRRRRQRRGFLNLAHETTFWLTSNYKEKGTICLVRFIEDLFWQAPRHHPSPAGPCAMPRHAHRSALMLKRTSGPESGSHCRHSRRRSRRRVTCRVIQSSSFSYPVILWRPSISTAGNRSPFFGLVTPSRLLLRILFATVAVFSQQPPDERPSFRSRSDTN